MDFLGQNVEIGDFLVIKAPYYHTLTLGRVKKLNPASYTVIYIPPWILEDEDVSFEDKEKILGALSSDDFAKYEKEGIILQSGRHHSGPWKFSLWLTSRNNFEVVKIDREQLNNFIDSRS